MTCAKCHQNILTEIDVWERVTVTTFRQNHQEGNTQLYHPACFIELAEEFAEDKVRFKLVEAQREAFENKRLLNEANVQIEELKKKATTADIQAVLSLAATRAEESDGLQKRVLGLEARLADLMDFAAKGLESLVGQKIVEAAGKADELEYAHFTFCWEQLWTLVGRAVAVEKNIAAVVARYNELTEKHAQLQEGAQAAHEKLKATEADLGVTQETLLTAIKERDSARYDKQRLEERLKTQEHNIKAVQEARDKLFTSRNEAASERDQLKGQVAAMSSENERLKRKLDEIKVIIHE